MEAASRVRVEDLQAVLQSLETELRIVGTAVQKAGSASKQDKGDRFTEVGAPFVQAADAAIEGIKTSLAGAMADLSAAASRFGDKTMERDPMTLVAALGRFGSDLGTARNKGMQKRKRDATAALEAASKARGRESAGKAGGPGLQPVATRQARKRAKALLEGKKKRAARA